LYRHFIGLLRKILENGGHRMTILTRKTDSRARLTLPSDFASCLVTVERRGNELRVRKLATRRYSFRQLMACVTKKNIHAEVQTGARVGREAL
jgi:hypothetical protein